ncbi:MAG: hypothetical protein LJE70_14145 [Chromatiaceae bacterium]|nr:hypothetical protein [Chromatiaceae bacterium]
MAIVYIERDDRNTKVLITIATGETYRRLERVTGLSRAHYARRHGWDYACVTEPSDFGVSRTDASLRAMQRLKLLVPSLFSRYRLAAFLDGDTLANARAPCLSQHADEIPPEGFAAVQTILPAERRDFLPDCAETYYDEFMSAGSRRRLIRDASVYVNSGVMLFRPQEVTGRWRSHFEQYAGSKLNDENILNLHEVQAGRCHLLDCKWNTLWLYEKYRRGHLRGFHRRINDPYFAIYLLKNRIFWRIWEPARIRRCLEESFVVHLAFERRKLFAVDPGAAS